MLRKALQAVLGFGLGGLGLGASARGVMGLRDLFVAPPAGPPSTALSPSLLPIPVPQYAGEDEEASPLRKAAATISKAAIGGLRPDFNWWQMPVSAALGAGGIAGGWKLMDTILDSRRRVEVEQELTDAKEDYDAALQEQYVRALTKRGVLDEVFEKFAAWGGDWGQLLQVLLGTYATGVGAATVAGGFSGYNWARARAGRRRTSPQSPLLQAMQKRRRALALQPGPFYAYPVPTRYPVVQKAQEEEERART